MLVQLRKSQPDFRYIADRGYVIDPLIILSNPIAYFLGIGGLAGEVDSLDNAAVLVYVGNSRMPILNSCIAACHKSRSAEQKGEKDKEDVKALFFHR